MLDRLPAEIVESILGHLPTLTAISNVSTTNKKLHETIRNGKSSIYHDFVHRQFPTIATKAPWQKTAIDLTTRSRAWDRKALIARECIPPGLVDNQQSRQQGQQQQGLDRQTFGYMPVIDSYETAENGTRQEALAWGAAGRLNLRFTSNNKIRWSSYCPMTEPDAQMDIVDVHLMRPHQSRNQNGESVLIRRHNRAITLLHASADTSEWDVTAEYQMPFGVPVDCIDVNKLEDPLLAACNEHSIHLFKVHDAQTKSPHQIKVPDIGSSAIKQRKRCAKFISGTRLAVAAQNLTGLQPAPIEVFEIGESSIAASSLTPIDMLECRKQIGSYPAGRIGANVIEKVNDASTGSGSNPNLLLSGWSDGLVRLYDMRASSSAVQEYWDPVDDGQIFSLLPHGRERFLAGSHQNGCLKTFDMRMNGRVYDYTEVSRAESGKGSVPSPTSRSAKAAREANIFLAVTVDQRNRYWRPIPGRAQNARLPRYNGSIYSLSTPSAASSTVFVGIENHVIQLDTVGSDDWTAKRGTSGTADGVLNLSCYERPRTGKESTDPVLLRKQRPLTARTDAAADVEAGWDSRWYLDQPRSSTKGMAAAWRRGQVT